jgi:carbamoyl-phosphate synthase small subunit
MKARLLLEDGKIFYGEHFGAQGTSIGEVVFNTGMTGYQEILTDPSYKGQMVTMTYPHIGNYGINPDDVESSRPHVEALIVREYCPVPSNYRSKETLDHYLQRNNIIGLHQIDTRALVRHIREKGAMMGILTTEEMPLSQLNEKLLRHPKIEGRDLVKYVTAKKQKTWENSIRASWYYDFIKPLGEKTFRVAAYDFGIKWNILRLMTALGLEVILVPASTSAEEIKKINPDGILLSNGPGDPEGVPYAIENVKKLIGYRPMFGICLGIQILGLAFGGRTYKLKFGHHGSNHPVKDLKTGIIEITAQNHNFAVETRSLEKAGFVLTHRNLNDGTVEGIEHRELPVFAVQYHPEASPGPHDSLYLFKRFYRIMEEHAKA